MGLPMSLTGATASITPPATSVSANPLNNTAQKTNDAWYKNPMNLIRVASGVAIAIGVVVAIGALVGVGMAGTLVGISGFLVVAAFAAIVAAAILGYALVAGGVVGLLISCASNDQSKDDEPKTTIPSTHVSHI